MKSFLIYNVEFNFCCTAKWLSYICIYIFVSIFFSFIAITRLWIQFPGLWCFWWVESETPAAPAMSRLFEICLKLCLKFSEWSINIYWMSEWICTVFWELKPELGRFLWSWWGWGMTTGGRKGGSGKGWVWDAGQKPCCLCRPPEARGRVPAPPLWAPSFYYPAEADHQSAMPSRAHDSEPQSGGISVKGPCRMKTHHPHLNLHSHSAFVSPASLHIVFPLCCLSKFTFF